MLLKGYTYKIVLPECDHSRETVNAIAELTDDISDVLPYLNAVVKRCTYHRDLGMLRFVRGGRGIILSPKQIAVTNLESEAEAGRVLESIKELINNTYERRAEIEPSYKSGDELKFLDVYKLLPGTNCGQCGVATCLAFATKLIRQDADIKDCVPLFTEEYGEKRTELMALLQRVGYI